MKGGKLNTRFQFRISQGQIRFKVKCTKLLKISLKQMNLEEEEEKFNKIHEIINYVKYFALIKIYLNF